jgi:UDP-N-acetylmuramate--alanine ligase
MNVLEARTLHFIGVGGAGMSPLAELLAGEGRAVSGSDLLESETTRHLRGAGVRVAIGHDARHLGKPDAVVVSAAIRPDNPELAAAVQAGIPRVRRADLLGALMRTKRGIAVAGAHGKTTTTAMTGEILAAAGLDPVVLVGGSFRGGGSNLRSGRGGVMVAEADEYDRAFHSLSPEIAVITNVDLEHLDTYRDLADLEGAFVQFANSGPRSGVVVAGVESAHVAAILPRVTRRVVTFSLEGPASVAARDVRVADAGARFTLLLDGRPSVAITLAVPGAHNVRNALAAIAAAREAGVPVEAAAAGLAGFQGMARRFESHPARGDIAWIDDYAHHPTEIAATLAAARAVHPGRRLVVVFQPHLYSRTRDHAGDFGKVLATADLVLVAPIYAAREQPLPGVTSGLIAEAAARAGSRTTRAPESEAEVLAALREELRPGDILLTMGAGDVAKFGAPASAGPTSIV